MVRVTATFASGQAKIAGAEAFIDCGVITPPATTAKVCTDGLGFPFVPSDGQFGSPTDLGTESGYGDIPLTTVALLSAGGHTISVHGRDTAGNWGVFATTVLTVNKSAPTVTNVRLVPALTNNGSVVITATATDAATGNNGIANGEYFIDAVGAPGTGRLMASTSATTLGATIPGCTPLGCTTAGTTGALSVGAHTIYVRARDGNANWSAPFSAVLTIDRTRPTFVSITRNGVSPTSANSVSYTVRFSEPVIGVGNADFQAVRVPLPGPNGPNLQINVSGSGATRVVTVSNYGDNFVGTVGLNVRSTATITDLAGNTWAASLQTGAPYVVDRAGPTFLSGTLTPNSIAVGTGSVSLTVNGAVDVGVAGVAGGEWWIAPPNNRPAGSGNAFTGTSGITIPTGTLAVGNYNVRVRIRDALGNWSAVRTVTLQVHN